MNFVALGEHHVSRSNPNLFFSLSFEPEAAADRDIKLFRLVPVRRIVGSCIQRRESEERILCDDWALRGRKGYPEVVRCV
jgi:hypothetical protein